MNRRIYFLIGVVFLCHTSFAQMNGTFQGTYHMLDSSELYVPRAAGKAFTPTAPPSGIIRAIPEWDPAQAVLVSYPGNFGIPYTLIAEMSQDCRVITIVESSTQQNTVTNNYNSNGVNTANCSFIVAPLNSYWTRDYGPWFIMVNNSEISIVDFPYNRPTRVNDDNVPVVMGTNLEEDVYGMIVLHTGGNYMCDGMGVAAMTDLVEDENTSLSHAQIDTMFKQYMGITKNYITTDPLGQYIKHIDCWAKFLDVDKILIASVPISNSQYSDYEAMASYWANEVSSYGNHYQVYRAYEPSGQPYTNSLILNKKVLMPFTSNATANNNAQAVYQQAMPGYEIIGFTQLPAEPWQSTDALHCRAHEVADKGMLYIKHMPILDQQNLLSQYMINAEIYALSGSSIVADSVWVRYKINNGAWTLLNMSNTGGNQWHAAITAAVAGDTVRYYIHAHDLSPRSAEHPLIGAPDPHKFWINNISGVAENPQPLALTFPNPANDNIFVQMKDCDAQDLSIQLTDVLGNEVISVKENNTCDRMFGLDVSKLRPGCYFLKIESGNRNITSKVMVMH